MSIGGPDVSVVLPCLNEADSVGSCVEEALRALNGAGLTGEVVVVDNGSSDDSAEVATRAGARVVRESSPGYGSALRAGFSAAAGDVVVMADADFTYNLSEMPAMVGPVLEGTSDMVLGDRLEAARATMPFLHRRVGTPVLSFLISRAAGGRAVHDSQSGYRAFRRDRAGDLGLRSGGMELASEMLIRAAQAGWKIDEVPVSYRDRVGDSKLRTFSDGWRHLRLIFLLAPDLFLIGPGLTAMALGALLTVVGFIQPAGLNIGSLRWQPVFFSSICLVLGMQAVLAGAVLAHRSSVAATTVRKRFSFVGSPPFPSRCLAAGAALLLVGVGIDFALFVGWVGGNPSPPHRGLPLASLAQTLIIMGGTLASSAILLWFLSSRPDGTTGASPDGHRA